VASTVQTEAATAAALYNRLIDVVCVCV